jgi:protein-S-isoprenylcysteine O-methyltransferase Ste14
LNWLLGSLALGMFVLFAWAIRTLFSHECGVDARMKVLQAAGSVSAGVHLISLFTSSPGRGSALISGIIYLTGLAVFAAAVRAVSAARVTLAFSPDIPSRLIETGIYAYLRHPFYWSYTLTWIAGVVGAPNPWTALTAILMSAFYAAAARHEEQKFEASALSFAYKTYRRRTWGLYGP